MTYKVKLEVFEGPLDLLLFLIKKNELDIYDIPISEITEQYLGYLEMMKMLDLNVAGEFLVMAATLMHIKSKMLLPPEEAQAAEAEEDDPRAELVRKLLEYKRFKEAAEQLKLMEARQQDVFVRVSGDAELEGRFSGEQYFEASLFDLISAFSKAVRNMPKEAFFEIVKEQTTVEQKIHDILHMLVKKPRLFLSELFRQARTKFEMVTAFLALLELIKQKTIFAAQKDLFGEIEIIRNPESVKAAV